MLLSWLFKARRTTDPGQKRSYLRPSAIGTYRSVDFPSRFARVNQGLNDRKPDRALRGTNLEAMFVGSLLVVTAVNVSIIVLILRR